MHSKCNEHEALSVIIVLGKQICSKEIESEIISFIRLLAIQIDTGFQVYSCSDSSFSKLTINSNRTIDHLRSITNLLEHCIRQLNPISSLNGMEDSLIKSLCYINKKKNRGRIILIAISKPEKNNQLLCILQKAQKSGISIDVCSSVKEYSEFIHCASQTNGIYSIVDSKKSLFSSLASLFSIKLSQRDVFLYPKPIPPLIRPICMGGDCGSQNLLEIGWINQKTRKIKCGCCMEKELD
eukprot:GHVP01071075.1.p1 GENE.GHVP01071075.1~~GHVP01071075.1.p1  ORF type:complete len:239 (-),score=31.06 GHVP01071075.1:346-1062(-)